MKLFFASIVILFSSGCFSLGHANDSITVSNSVIQIPMVRGGVAKGLVTLKNNSLGDDLLKEVIISRASRVEIHESYIKNEISKMRKVVGIPIKGNNQFDMGLKGFHFMIFDLDDAIVVGDKIVGRLVFQVAGEIDVDFEAMRLNMSSHNTH